MFGFLNGGCEPSYRRLYAFCCQNQFARCGRLSTVFHSYESVFLAALACDVGALDGPAEDAVRCCRLIQRKKEGVLDIDRIPEEVGEFLASFTLLLVHIKLADDIQDANSIPARIARLTLKRKIDKAIRFFTSMDPAFESRLEQILESHQRLETQAHVSLAEFCEPTAQGFAYLFGLFGQQLVDQGLVRADEAAEVAEGFAATGAHVGRAIIAFDCAVDWRKDQKRSEFNPLKGPEDIHAAVLTTKRELVKLGWQCTRLAQGSSGSSSNVLTAQIARRRFDRVAAVNADALSRNSVPARRQLKSSLPALRRGDCSCDCPVDACCGGGDCGGCGGCDGAGAGGGDAACCDNGCTKVGCCDAVQGCDGCHCCCDGLFCHEDRRKSKRGSASGNGAEPHSTPTTPEGLNALVGRVAVAVGPLNPQGIVSIDGREIPANSDSGWVHAGEKVIVISVEQFGVKVRHA